MVFPVKLVWWDYVLVVGYRMDAGVLSGGTNHVPSRCECMDSAARQQAAGREERAHAAETRPELTMALLQNIVGTPAGLKS
jgi:hypothetical protein